MSFLIAGAVTAGVAGATKLGVAISGRGKRIAEQEKANKENERMMAEYKALDTSNPYANMQNTMEDLTVNQQQAQFQAQQGAQQRANIMQSMKGAAGGSGIAALAQVMANQGQLASQQASASIGQQESRNQMAAAQQAASIQMQERVGDARSQDLEAQKTATLLGMSQQRVAAANQARAQAKAAQMSAIGDIGEVGMQMIKGGGDDDGGVDNTEDNEYQVDPNAPASKKAVSIGKKAKGN
tara:strand:+ start:488 stop:1207 length:720 start_codon:yes stop_codon:yes gene_type:complete